MAIGDVNDVVDISISENSVSSSILKNSKFSEDNFKGVKTIGRETVKIARLDSMPELFKDKENLVKIDVQGNEGNVLNGMKGVLKYISAIEIELSLIELYDEQPLYFELLDLVRSIGFNFPVYFETHPGRTPSGYMSQIDMILFKSNYEKY